LSRWIPLGLALLALAVERSFPAVHRRAPRWGRLLLEIGAPLIAGPAPLVLALGAGWLSLREVGWVGPLRLAPGTFLGWPPADWIRGLGLAGLYGGLTLLAFRAFGLWRWARVPWAVRLEALGMALAREALLGLGRGALMAAGRVEDPLPVAWAAFGVWWAVRRGFGARGAAPWTPEVWGSALGATALFGLTGHLGLSAATHGLLAALLCGPAPAAGADDGR